MIPICSMSPSTHFPYTIDTHDIKTFRRDSGLNKLIQYFCTTILYLQNTEEIV